MKYHSNKEANFGIFDDYAKPAILTRGNPEIKSIYDDVFIPAFLKHCQDFQPISLKTFYRYCINRIDPDKKISAQQGKSALKHETHVKKAKYTSEGFGLRVEVDAYHEPIALLDPTTFKPTGKRPIIYLAVECHTTIVVGFAIDYESGTELTGYVIELYRSMIFMKPDFQVTYGTRYPFIFYLRPYLVYRDGGAAFNSHLSVEFLRMAGIPAGLSSTQDAPAKAYVENCNKQVKKGFTKTLPGHYNDNQKINIDPKHYSRYATLTTPEHNVLFMRYICDEYNYGTIKSKGFNRAKQWITEIDFYFSGKLRNPKALKSFNGVQDQKTIQKAVGIQFHINSKTYTYNSNALQKLRRKLLNKKLSIEVEYTRNVYELGQIRVRNVIEDDILIVPRITAKDSDIKYLGSETFYSQFIKTQRLEVLASMSREEIIEGALDRKRKIEEYKAEKSNINKKEAEDLSAVIKQDKEEFEKLIRSEALDDSKTKKDTSVTTDNVDESEQEAKPKTNWNKPEEI